MEHYTGVKFGYEKAGDLFAFDERLALLNSWAFVLAQLGLTPVHAEGAYGNQSYRTGNNSLIITCSGMVPEKELNVENYVLIEGLDRQSGDFVTRGSSAPSSESMLHFLVYQNYQEIGAIMHGHSSLFEQYASTLGVPVTPAFYPYGTLDLAQSAVDILGSEAGFIILKNHGFVAIGSHVNEVASLVLDYYQKLIEELRRQYT